MAKEDTICKGFLKKMLLKGAWSLFVLFAGLYLKGPAIKYGGHFLRSILFYPDPASCAHEIIPSKEDPRYSYNAWTVTIPMKHRKTETGFLLRNSDSFFIIADSLKGEKVRVQNELLDDSQKRVLGFRFALLDGDDSNAVIKFTTKGTGRLKAECEDLNFFLDHD